tara:strand:+ start:2394 stop:2627 length:234 start_codon:yes stop_codon:yes gene_type:complete
MKLYDIGVNDKGTILKLWVCDDDENNIREWRGNLVAVLEHVFKDLVLNNWDKVKPKTKWGYPRLTKKETKDLLEWNN